MFDRVIYLFSIGFGSGLSPWMPGTCGSIVGLLLYIPLRHYLSFVEYNIFLLGTFIFGVYACDVGARVFQRPDPPAVVFDEMHGIWLTLCLSGSTYLELLVSFGLFRVFDILKPWPIRRVDQSVKGGFGIMLDDTIAACFSLIILYFISHTRWVPWEKWIAETEMIHTLWK